jgi:hypothetical protein
MAKTTTVVQKVDIVDLIRDRKQFPLLDVPPMRVTVNIEVTTTGLITTPKPAPSAKMARLEKAARDKMEEYETIITKECATFNKKIDDLLNEGKVKEAAAMAEMASHAVKNALATAEGAASKAVEEMKKKEFQGDKLLTEARVKTTTKVVFSGVSITTHALHGAVHTAGIAASAGTHVLGYAAVVSSGISIVKSLASLGLELKQQLKGEPQLRADLFKGMDAYVKFRATAVMQIAQKNGLVNTSQIPGFPQAIEYVATGVLQSGKDMFKGKDKAQVAKEIYDFTVKAVQSHWADVQKARELYRNHTSKMRQKVDGISQSADKLATGMKQAASLKEGIKIGAECMALKATVRNLTAALDEAQGFLTQIEASMQDYGLKVDDRTIMDKVRQLDKLTLVKEGMSLASHVEAIHGLFDAVKEAATAA